jgi:hypothetical protein
MLSAALLRQRLLRRGAGYRFVVIWEYVHDLG